jgi:hypothetical protein
MSMPLGFASKVSVFSMRRRLVRTILSLLPCLLLIAVMFVGSTIPNGLVNELDRTVLSTVESRQEIVVLDSYMFTSFGGYGSKGAPSSTFNADAYKAATTAPMVEEVYPQKGQVSGEVVALENIQNTQLSFAGSNAEFTKLYTDKPFIYTPGSPIPVLLNPSNIGGQQYNWEGSDKIEIDYSKPDELEKKLVYSQLDKNIDLVGKTFTVKFGEFGVPPDAFEEMKQTSGFAPPKSTVLKLTDNDRDIIERRIREIYAPYWDVDALRTPITAEFVVVGVIKGQNISTQGFIRLNIKYGLLKTIKT